jgi:glycosyltransferase involved in cell wall biosynthesis
MIAPRKSVMVLCGFYLPGYIAGGPIRSISSITENLGDEFDFHIITSNHDLNSETPYPEIQSDQWNRIGKAAVYYVPDGIRSLATIAGILRKTPYDMLYLNSFFSPKYSIWPLLLAKCRILPVKPVLLAPRGEFSDAALGLKAFKKRLYRAVSSLAGLYDQVFWHASTPSEKSDIARNFGVGSEAILTSRVLVASDMVAMNQSTSDAMAQTEAGQGQNALRVCFLSRISPMKNLQFALQVLQGVRSNIVLTIHGPKEDPEYWGLCQQAIDRLPAHISVHYAGPVDSDKVVEAIAAHDLLFVPTLGENFGHVFIESWSAGVPVLISDRTPWRDLFNQNLGWDLPLGDVQPFIDALHEAAGWSDEMRLQVRSACRTMANDIIFDAKAIESNRNLFLTVLGKSQS